MIVSDPYKHRLRHSLLFLQPSLQYGYHSPPPLLHVCPFSCSGSHKNLNKHDHSSQLLIFFSTNKEFRPYSFGWPRLSCPLTPLPSTEACCNQTVERNKNDLERKQYICQVNSLCSYCYMAEQTLIIVDTVRLILLYFSSPLVNNVKPVHT